MMYLCTYVHTNTVIRPYLFLFKKKVFFIYWYGTLEYYQTGKKKFYFTILIMYGTVPVPGTVSVISLKPFTGIYFAHSDIILSTVGNGTVRYGSVFLFGEQKKF